MKKKIMSVAVALGLCAALAVPVCAAERTVLLDGYSSIQNGLTPCGTFETTIGGELAISGEDLKQIGSVIYPTYGETATDYTCPVYTASGSVTITCLGKNPQVDLISYDATKQFYETIEENVTTFEDGVLTLSKPGSYHVSAYILGLEGGCEAFFVLDETYGSNEGTSNFTDVSANAYYADAVKWAVDKGVTSGTTATTFSPNNTCTTAHILTFLWRANGSPAPTGKNAAVPAGKYYTDAANWALEKGLTDAFNPDAPATRAATVTYLWKLAGKPSAKAPASFTDVATGAAYANAVAWAVEQGITGGTTATTFAPDNTCTRGQIVTFLYRDAFGESTSENGSSGGQSAASSAGGNSYEQDISALMAEGYTREEAHEILELMAGGYSEESAKDMVGMTEEDLKQQWQDWAEELGGYYDPETGALWVP